MEDIYATQAPTLVALCIAMIILSTICIILRVWAKLLYSGSSGQDLWWDDLLAFMTFPFNIGVIAMCLAWVAKGLGTHCITVPPHFDWIIDGIRYYFVASILYPTAIIFPKYSMLFFYARIFSTRSRLFKYNLWFAGGLVTAWFIYTVTSSAMTFTCLWIPLGTVPFSCVTSFFWYTAAATVNVFIDIYIMVIPIPLLIKLHLNKTRKSQLIGLFLLGGCIVIISSGRLVAIVEIQRYVFVDWTWDLVPVFAWAICEGPVLTLGICLPSINILLQRVRRHGFRSLFSRQIPSSTDGASTLVGSMESKMTASSSQQSQLGYSAKIASTRSPAVKPKTRFRSYRIDDDLKQKSLSVRTPPKAVIKPFRARSIGESEQIWDRDGVYLSDTKWMSMSMKWEHS